MKKLIISLLAVTLLFTACGKKTDNQHTATTPARSEIPAAQTTPYTEQLQKGEISFDNRYFINKVTEEYNDNPCSGVEEIELFRYEKGEYSFRVWRVFENEETDEYWLACRFKNNRLIGFIPLHYSGLEELWREKTKEDFAFAANEDFSYVAVKINGSEGVNEFQFYHDSYSTWMDEMSVEETLAYRENDQQTVLNAVKAADSTMFDKYEKKLLLPLVETGVISMEYPYTEFMPDICLNFYAKNEIEPNKDAFIEKYGTGDNKVSVPAAEVFAYLKPYFENFKDNRYFSILTEDKSYNPDTEEFLFEVDKIFENPYKAEIINGYENDKYLALDFFVSYKETSPGVVQSVIFEKQNGEYIPKDRQHIYFGDWTAQSKDGRYQLYMSNISYPQTDIVSEVFMYDTAEKTSQHIGFIEGAFTPRPDIGFFSNGDIYVMNRYQLKAFEINNGKAVQKFTTADNFPCGLNIDGNNTQRHLFALRRDPEKFNYIVIYGEYVEKENYYDNYINDFQMVYTYKVGLLDKQGNLTKSWDTGAPISQIGNHEVKMYKVSEDEIEFYVHYYKYESELRSKGRFNLVSGTYTPVFEYKPH